ncbi:serine/threonine-protein kinase Nek2-like [Anthonomus grandis grandis]|uniref:serine/threonine-protein kinase Nek2-like n=1 Tax=Anthonomus grandis grandis TaxID=2921223 RepID=UPI0021663F4F|nr:serine/threonine-protein kinase Nek2-like [Anthonomus grandis grandis]
MDSLSDYDFLTHQTSLPSSFKVHHKPTENTFCLQSVPLSDLSDTEQKALIKKIKIRTGLRHPNVLAFYHHLQHENVLYIKQEYCENGTLTDFILKECIEKERQLHETFICKLLYQIVFALKTVECFMGQLNLDTLMLDKDYNIKLYNFFNIETGQNQKQKEIKMSQLGATVFQLSTLKQFDKSSFEKVLQKQDYSEAFKGLLVALLKDSSEIKKHINKVLCHPTVLLQSSQWCKDRCFIEKTITKTDTLSEHSEYADKLEKLRRREAALQVKEQLLKEQERKLAHKEKKLQVMERAIKEKMQQAELYLKRSRESKSVSSGASSKMSYEDIEDPNYVTCDSVILPTSAKLQVEKIAKPHNFTRTLSEKRIRFKTSPLKDHNFTRNKVNFRKSLRHSKILEQNVVNIENIPPEDRRKSLFNEAGYENDVVSKPCGIKSLGWTEETKKYAFDMLRIMNSDENIDGSGVRHTSL